MVSFTNSAAHLPQFLFSDGTVWDLAAIASRTTPVVNSRPLSIDQASQQLLQSMAAFGAPSPGELSVPMGYPAWNSPTYLAAAS